MKRVSAIVLLVLQIGSTISLLATMPKIACLVLLSPLALQAVGKLWPILPLGAVVAFLLPMPWTTAIVLPLQIASLIPQFREWWDLKATDSIYLEIVLREIDG